MIRCPICARREPADGATVCGICLGRIDDDLARILELVTLAAGWLMPRGGSGSSTRAVPASRPPLDIASLDAALGTDVLPVLEAWERLTREEAGLSPYGAATALETATVARSVQWLRSWLLWTSERFDYPIEDYAREVRDLRVSLERLDPEQDRPDGIRVACDNDHPDADGRRCGYRLVVDASMLATDVECRRCGNVTTGGRMILGALNDPDVTVWAYPDVIEATLGIPARTLRDWAARGVIKRNGSRYDVGAAFRRRAA